MKMIQIIVVGFFLTGGAPLLAAPEASDSSQEQEEKEPTKLPSYHNTRYQEDWSVLQGANHPSSGPGPFKFIPLNESGSVYLSLGGAGKSSF